MLPGIRQVLGNQGRVEASALPVESFSEDTDQDGDTHIYETFVNVSVLERIPCREERSAPLFVPYESA